MESQHPPNMREISDTLRTALDGLEDATRMINDHSSKLDDLRMCISVAEQNREN